MKKDTNNIIRSLFIVGFILSLFVSSQAQSKNLKQQPWNWKNHKRETIDYAKKYLVSNIEPNLPPLNFAKWFRKLVGKEAKILWRVNDCGEKAVTPGNVYGSKDFTMCVEVNATIGSDVWVGVFIQFGTLKDGITPGKPVIRCIYVSREDNPTKSLDSLTDFSERLYAIID